MTMTNDRQERIRNRAHQIWLDEGQPVGQHERHWHQAATDVDGEDAGAAPKAGAKKPAKKAAPKEAKTAKPAAKIAKAAPKAAKPKKSSK
ncbi:DUF2934 domain-containing protein [Mesorhizobium sp. INR15]|nr:DUF2934 domain-containing protein [Mesorhizobium sp. INR15]